MTRRSTLALTIGIICFSMAVSAQQPPAAGQKITLAASLQRGFQNLQRNLNEAADKMPEADYSFKPTPQMRPFSQVVAHIALAQFNGCSRYKGEPNPNQQKKEETITTKAEAVALLKASSALCSEVFAGLTDENINELIKAGNNEVARGNFVAGANSHGNELYGTMAVYLRLKGLVPPTTEREEQQRKAAAAAEAPKTPAK
jgi:hypothetical protein